MTMAISEDTGNNNNPSKKDIERPGHLGNLTNNGGLPPGSRGGGPNIDMMEHQSCEGYSRRTTSSGPPSTGNKWTPQIHGGSWEESQNSVMEPTYAPLVKVEPAASMASSALSPSMSTLPPASTMSHQGSPDCFQTNTMIGSNSGGSSGTTGSSASMISTECSSCGDLITDRFILQVANRSWHANCLRCTVCHAILDGQTSCFLKDELLYCKSDYTKLFGAKCFKCCRMISPADWVRKAKEQVYHLACFACDSCKRQLSTGEEFGIHENRVLCKTHYMEMIDGGSTSSDAESGGSETHSKKKTKRMRTTFTEEQVQILQANFQIDSNPDGQDLERIAQITGLSKRVTQVWFQNCRARQKKYINSGKRGGGSNSGGKTVPMAGLSPVPRDQCSTPQLDLHVMYSTFRAQPPSTSADSNPDPEMSQDSNPGNSNYMRGEV